MMHLQILSFVILVSLWSFSEAVDNEIEIGELTLLRGSHHHDYKEESFVCPAIYGRYPHEKDCSLFYECRYGYAHLIQCNRGKLYDEKKEQCNDKRRVNCDRSGKDHNRDRDHDHDQKELEKDDQSKSFECPYIWGTFAHPTDCSKYFVCVYKVPRLFQCYGSDLYDERSRKCLDKRRVNCGKRLDKDQMKTSRRPDVHTSSIRPRDKTTTMWPRDKTTTMRPRDRTTTMRPRDRTTTIRPKDKTTTMWPRDETTTMRPRDRTTTVWPRYKTTTMWPRDETTTMRPRDRTTTIWPRYKTTTMWPKDKTTTMRPRDLITTIRPTENPSTEEYNRRFRCPFPNGRFADPLDCSQFYECRSAVPTFHKCPKSNLYNERKEECVKDKYVKCGDRPGGVVGEDDDKNKDKKDELRCPYLWGMFPHPKDCSKYLICIYNVPTVYNCDKDELFHAKYRRCFPKGQVTCDYRINPDDLIPHTRRPRSTTIYRTTRTPTTTWTPTTTSSPVSTTINTTPVVTTTTIPTTQPTTIIPTTQPTTTTAIPTTQPTTTTAIPTTQPTTTTAIPTTQPTTTTAIPTTQPTTTIRTTQPTTTVPTTQLTTIVPTTQSTTAVPTTPTTIVPVTNISTTQPTTLAPKPNTPPPTECEEDDLDCIIDVTGDVRGWFDCPERYGHFPHGSSHQLFIHCDNWYPYVKICADGTVFSPKYLVCMWLNQPEI